MQYRVKDRTTITREDGTLLGAGNLLKNPTALEIASNLECLEVVPELAPNPKWRPPPPRKKRKPKKGEN